MGISRVKPRRFCGNAIRKTNTLTRGIFVPEKRKKSRTEFLSVSFLISFSSKRELVVQSFKSGNIGGRSFGKTKPQTIDMRKVKRVICYVARSECVRKFS